MTQFNTRHISDSSEYIFVENNNRQMLNVWVYEF